MAINLTQEEYVDKVKHKHGNRYSFEKCRYKTSRIEVIITCTKHNYDFNVVPSVLLGEKKKGKLRNNMVGSCPMCQEEYQNNLKEQFIEKMRAAHNYEYDYDVDNYVNDRTKFNAICKKHGKFSVYPSNHVRGSQKCLFCELETEKIKTIEGVKYYSCDVHGIFPVGKDRTKASGCLRCNAEKRKQEQIQKFNEKINIGFGSDYDIFITEVYVEFRCKKHGTRTTVKRNEVGFSTNRRTCYCDTCNTERITKIKQEAREALEKKCREVISSEYVGVFEFLEFCDNDGDIRKCMVRLNNLVNGGVKELTAKQVLRKTLSPDINKSIPKGSHISFDEAKSLMRKLGITSLRQYKKWRKRTSQPTLPSNPHRSYKEWQNHYDFFDTNVEKDMSTGELRIRDYLERKSLEYVFQKKYDDCRNINPLPFDFYVPKYDLIIEFDGYHHYYEVKLYNASLETVQKHDGIKNKYCVDNGINIVRIPYWELEDNTVEWTLDNEITRMAAEQAAQ